MKKRVSLEEDTISKFILGDAKVVETISKEELLANKLSGDHLLNFWAKCFVRTLIQNKLQVNDFIKAYGLFKEGDKSAILKLNLLPTNLTKSKRLAILYMEAIFYVTLRKELNKISKPLPPLSERIGNPEYI